MRLRQIGARLYAVSVGLLVLSSLFAFVLPRFLGVDASLEKTLPVTNVDPTVELEAYLLEIV